MTTILGNGVYGLSEAARLTRLKTSRLREWFREETNRPSRSRVFVSDYQDLAGGKAISFLDLIEVFVAGQLREHGVSLQTLRKVRQALKHDLGTKHPFSRQEVRSNGRTVFTIGLDDDGRSEMIDVLNRQRVFAEILLPFLKTIDYDRVSKLASKWSIAKGVVVDPRICFGKPIVADVGIKTSVLANAYTVNDEDAEAVADWYDVLPEHVMDAVRFERSFAA